MSRRVVLHLSGDSTAKIAAAAADGRALRALCGAERVPMAVAPLGAVMCLACHRAAMALVTR